MKKIKLSTAERVILENLDKREYEWKWITRTKDNELVILNNEPDGKYYGGNAIFLCVFNHLFQFIKVGDEPYNIKQLLEVDDE